MLSHSWHSPAQPLLVKEITQILGMHEFVTVKATSNRPNIMYTVEKLETVPDEEVGKREQLMDHILVKLFVTLITMGRKPPK